MEHSEILKRTRDEISSALQALRYWEPDSLSRNALEQAMKAFDQEHPEILPAQLEEAGFGWLVAETDHNG